MSRRPHRHRRLTVLTAALCLVPLLAACHKKAPLGKPWVRLDLTKEKPFVESTPPGLNEDQVYQQRVAQLGAAEVRDLSHVPPDQLKQFPKGSAADVRVVEQTAGSRLKWRVHAEDGSYVSFVPLGFEKPCAGCKFRFGVRNDKGGVDTIQNSISNPDVVVEVRDNKIYAVNFGLHHDANEKPMTGENARRAKRALGIE